MIIATISAVFLATVLAMIIRETLDADKVQREELKALILALCLWAAILIGMGLRAKQHNVRAESEPEQRCYEEFGIFWGGDFAVRMTGEEFATYCLQENEK